MALTAPQITELKTLLTRDTNNVSEDGLLVQVEKASGGDSQKTRAARVRVLLTLL
jgi:hypothetical protein